MPFCMAQHRGGSCGAYMPCIAARRACAGKIGCCNHPLDSLWTGCALIPPVLMGASPTPITVLLALMGAGADAATRKPRPTHGPARRSAEPGRGRTPGITRLALPRQAAASRWPAPRVPITCLAFPIAVPRGGPADAGACSIAGLSRGLYRTADCAAGRRCGRAAKAASRFRDRCVIGSDEWRNHRAGHSRTLLIGAELATCWLHSSDSTNPLRLHLCRPDRNLSVGHRLAAFVAFNAGRGFTAFAEGHLAPVPRLGARPLCGCSTALTDLCWYVYPLGPAIALPRCGDARRAPPGQEYNLTVSLRLSWFPASFLGCSALPWPSLGVPLECTSCCGCTASQFHCCTRRVGRLGPLEWVLNTPSRITARSSRPR